MNLIEQLVKIYLEKENWHKFKITEKEAIKYHAQLLGTGNIIIEEKNGIIVGYVEFWKINLEQFIRIMAGEILSACRENIQDGNICYVANVWIDEKSRYNGVCNILKHKLFALTKNCVFYTGFDTKRDERLRIKFQKRSNDGNYN